MAQSQGFSLKDQLFNAEKVAYLAGLFSAADAGFDQQGFEAAVMGRLLDFELKERINWIADCLGNFLPTDLPEAAPMLRAALPPPLDPTLTDDEFGDFIFAPLGEFVVKHGLKDHPDLALGLIRDLTMRFSMEWSIRPFLNQWQDKTLDQMAVWAKDGNYHVRRLVSEGTRPRLPWGEGVKLAMDTPLPLLDQLHADPTRYVTRSVANHLNDISKKDADLVLDRLSQWRTAGKQTTAELDWMTRHALRGLVKDGHPGAMKMLGFDPDAPIEVVTLNIPKQIAIGEALSVAVTLRSPEPTGALVDYLFWRHRPDGKPSCKVHKLKQVQLGADDLVTLTKRHVLRGNATTFTLYPGPHRIEIQVNGRVVAGKDFELLPA